jgi:hypothetical protein
MPGTDESIWFTTRSALFEPGDDVERGRGVRGLAVILGEPAG